MCSSIHQFVILQRYSNLPNFGCPIIVPQIRVTGKYERAGHSLETTSIWVAAEQTPPAHGGPMLTGSPLPLQPLTGPHHEVTLRPRALR